MLPGSPLNIDYSALLSHFKSITGIIGNFPSLIYYAALDFI